MNIKFDIFKRLFRKNADIINVVKPYSEDEDGNYTFEEPLPFKDLPEDVQEMAVERYSDISVDYDWWDGLDESFKENTLTPIGLDGTQHEFNLNPNECAWDFNVLDYGLFAKALWKYVGARVLRTWGQSAKTIFRAVIEGGISIQYRHSSLRHSGQTTVDDYAGLEERYPRVRFKWDDALSTLEGACEEYFGELESRCTSMLSNEYEYRTSRESIEEMLIMNEYTFNERGIMAGSAAKFPKFSDMVGAMNAMSEGVRTLDEFVSMVKPWQIWTLTNYPSDRGRFLFIVDAQIVKSDLVGDREQGQQSRDRGVQFAHAFWSSTATDKEYVQAWHDEGQDFGAVVWASELPARLILTDWRYLLTPAQGVSPEEPQTLAAQADMISRLQPPRRLDDSWADYGVIRGTLNPADLIPALVGFLVEYGEAETYLMARYPRSMAALETAKADGNSEWWYTDEALYFLHEGLEVLMNNIAPPGTYFGSSEGDASDIGFWYAEDEQGENPLLHRTSGRQAVADALNLVSAPFSIGDFIESPDTGSIWKIIGYGTWAELKKSWPRIAKNTNLVEKYKDSTEPLFIGQMQGKRNLSVGTAAHMEKVFKSGHRFTYKTMADRPAALKALQMRGQTESSFSLTFNKLSSILHARKVYHNGHETDNHLFDSEDRRSQRSAQGGAFGMAQGVQNTARQTSRQTQVGSTLTFADALATATPPPIEYPTVDDLIQTNADIMEEEGRPAQLWADTPQRLEAAIGRMQSGFGDYEMFPTLIEKAAVLIHSMITGHVFVDGCKRSSIEAAMDFLNMNGVTDEVIDKYFGIGDGGLEDLTVKVAMNEMSHAQLVEWLHQQHPPTSTTTASLRFADMIGVKFSVGDRLTSLWGDHDVDWKITQIAPKSEIWSEIGTGEWNYDDLSHVPPETLIARLEHRGDMIHLVNDRVLEMFQPYDVRNVRRRKSTADMVSVMNAPLPLKGQVYKPTRAALMELNQKFDAQSPRSSVLTVGEMHPADAAYWARFDGDAWFVRDAEQAVKNKDSDTILIFCWYGTEHWGARSFIITLLDFWSMTSGLAKAAMKKHADAIDLYDVKAAPGRRILTSFSIVTPESVQEGDYATAGWEDEVGETVDVDARDMAAMEFDNVADYVAYVTSQRLRDLGASEMSGRGERHYYGEYYDYEDEDSPPGSQKQLAYHLHGFTDEELEKIADLFGGLMRGRGSLTFAGVSEDSIVSDQDVETDPSEAQIESGNYKKGHIRIHGLDITIENPKGSTRSGEDKDGHEWSQKMHADYGYIKGFRGKDKDQLDVFIGEHHDSEFVYVVNQKVKDGQRFDEHKAVLGTHNEDDAQDTYLANYDKNWLSGQGGALDGVAMTVQQFRDWLENGDTQKAVTLKCVQKTMQTSADMVDIVGDSVNVGDVVITKDDTQYMNSDDDEASGITNTPYTYGVLAIRRKSGMRQIPNMHIRIKRKRYEDIPLQVAPDETYVLYTNIHTSMGQPDAIRPYILAQPIGEFLQDHQKVDPNTIRGVRPDWVVPVGKPRQTAGLTLKADMLGVADEIDDLKDWTSAISHTFIFRRRGSGSVFDIVNTFITEHMTSTLMTAMRTNGCPNVPALMRTAHIRLLSADPVDELLTFGVYAPWNAKYGLMLVDVPLEQAKTDLADVMRTEATMPQPVRDQLDYPNFAATQERRLRDIIESAGATFDGVNDFGQFGQLVFFSDKGTKSTAALPVGKVTPETVVQKLNELRAGYNVHL